MDEIKRARWAREDRMDQTEGGWCAEWVVCLVCQRRHVVVFPAVADPNTLECPTCRARISEVLWGEADKARAPADPDVAAPAAVNDYPGAPSCPSDL